MKTGGGSHADVDVAGAAGGRGRGRGICPGWPMVPVASHGEFASPPGDAQHQAADGLAVDACDAGNLAFALACCQQAQDSGLPMQFQDVHSVVLPRSKEKDNVLPAECFRRPPAAPYRAVKRSMGGEFGTAKGGGF